MKKLILLLFIPLVFACGSDSSEDHHTDPCPNQPQLTTYEVSNISIDENSDFVSATFEGEILNIELGTICETFSITNQGFVYSTDIQPTTSDNVVSANDENAYANVSNLMPEATYYVRAYLTNTLGTFYGNEVSFTTPQSTNPIYLAENGITIKARDWANIGDSGIIEGVEYTVISEQDLRNRVDSGDDIQHICTTKITNMSYLFESSNFDLDISSWDTSNVLSMEGMFKWASSFSQPLGDWNVSNVANMYFMFNGATSFNQPIGDWDVSNVTTMEGMFSNASSFSQPLGDWDVSNVTNMYFIFNGTTSFNQDLNSWDVSNVTNMGVMFFNSSFNESLNSWDVSNVEDMSSMFGNSDFNQDLSNWNVESVTDCLNFCVNTTNWTLPKPEFSNCGDTGCD